MRVIPTETVTNSGGPAGVAELTRLAMRCSSRQVPEGLGYHRRGFQERQAQLVPPTRSALIYWSQRTDSGGIRPTW